MTDRNAELYAWAHGLTDPDDTLVAVFGLGITGPAYPGETDDEAGLE